MSPQPLPALPRPKCRLLFVAAEFADFIKAGGLGDVAAALPRALQSNFDVRLLLPAYTTVLDRCGPVTRVGTLPAHHDIPASILLLAKGDDGLPVYLVDNPTLFDRPGSAYVTPDGTPFEDNAKRFATLSWAAACMALGRVHWTTHHGFVPDVLHLNDWHSALAPAYVHWEGGHVPSLMTIHNLAYQGLMEEGEARSLGIPMEPAVEFYGKASPMKAGLLHATRLTTVSPHYSRQILTPEFGCGLDGVLRERAGRGDLTGILNGIDPNWNPATDPRLHQRFSVEALGGREANRAHVATRFGFEPGVAPLFAVVSRLVHQKGIDLVEDNVGPLVQQGARVAILGEGDKDITHRLHQMAGRFGGQVSVQTTFDETLARDTYAGADFLLMPSRFEPCGLSQMYAQRMGCLPVASSTGGLVDTVEDGKTGLLLESVSAQSLGKALLRALALFEKQAHTPLQKAAMGLERGWDRVSPVYESLYHALHLSGLRPAA